MPQPEVDYWDYTCAEDTTAVGIYIYVEEGSTALVWTYNDAGVITPPPDFEGPVITHGGMKLWWKHGNEYEFEWHEWTLNVEATAWAMFLKMENVKTTDWGTTPPTHSAVSGPSPLTIPSVTSGPWSRFVVTAMQEGMTTTTIDDDSFTRETNGNCGGRIWSRPTTKGATPSGAITVTGNGPGDVAGMLLVLAPLDDSPGPELPLPVGGHASVV